MLKQLRVQDLSQSTTHTLHVMTKSSGKFDSFFKNIQSKAGCSLQSSNHSTEYLLNYASCFNEICKTCNSLAQSCSVFLLAHRVCHPLFWSGSHITDNILHSRHRNCKRKYTNTRRKLPCQNFQKLVWHRKVTAKRVTFLNME